MHLFNMKGTWSGGTAWLYDTVVAAGIDPLYEGLASFFFSDLPQGHRLLDLGCGSGQISFHIARQNPLAQVLGIDLAEGQIARARSRAAGLKNLSFEVGNAQELKQPDNYFDQVVSCASIKHWPDPLAGLREMHRVCKPGGRIVIIEADSQTTLDKARYFVSYWRYVLSESLIAFYFKKFVAEQGISTGQLKELVTAAGFSEVLVQETPSLPLVIAVGRKQSQS